MDIPTTLAEIATLSVDERLAMVEAIWDSIAAESEQPPLTQAQIEEIERRLTEHEANPDAVVSWDEVKAQALSRLRT